jgi:hypothetical protein
MNSKKPLRGLLARAPLAAAVSMALLSVPTAQAFEFQRGGVTGSLDTTVSYGISIRAQDQDEDLIGKAYFNPLLCTTNVTLPPGPPGLGACSTGFSGSTAQLLAPGRFSVNRDDGNVKYDKGEPFSNAIKITSELSLKWENWGLFTRASYFYDFENAGRDDLTDAAQEKVGEDLRLLDAFIYRDFQVGDHSGTVLQNPPASPGRTAGFYVEYPEDIQMYGMSWNTTLPGGIAWQGEMSYRPNMPLQVDDVELLFAALSPLNSVIPVPGADFCSQLNPGCTPGTFNTGGPSDQPWKQNGYVRGWRRHEVSQLQMTFTKAFPSVLGSEQVALVGEIGATEVWDLPSHDVLRYEGEGTDTGGGPDVGDVLATCFDANPDPAVTTIVCPGAVTLPGALRNPLTQQGGFPTQFSWGYRVAARADYNSVFGTPITLSPRIAFNHDVNGITPGPGGNFLEDRKSATVGLEANYLNKWLFDLSYTAFFGGGKGGSTEVALPVGVECPSSGSTAGGACEIEGTPFNQIHDRDFYSFTVKYSF